MAEFALTKAVEAARSTSIIRKQSKSTSRTSAVQQTQSTHRRVIDSNCYVQMDAETVPWVGIVLTQRCTSANRRAAALLKKHSVIVTNDTNDPLRWRHTANCAHRPVRRQPQGREVRLSAGGATEDVHGPCLKTLPLP